MRRKHLRVMAVSIAVLLITGAVYARGGRGMFYNNEDIMAKREEIRQAMIDGDYEKAKELRNEIREMRFAQVYENREGNIENRKEYGYSKNQASTGEKAKALSGLPIDRIGLSPEQREKILLLRKENLKVIHEIQNKLSAKQDELDKLLFEYGSDNDKINEIIVDISELHKELLSKRAERVRQLKNVLTKEQFSKLNKITYRLRHRGRRF